MKKVVKVCIVGFHMQIVLINVLDVELLNDTLKSFARKITYGSSSFIVTPV